MSIEHQEILEDHTLDKDGNQTGGWTRGLGIDIKWHDGARGIGENRKPLNGATIVGVLECVLRRLQWFQRGKNACKENQQAIEAIERAINALDSRSIDRQTRNVEGTYQP